MWTNYYRWRVLLTVVFYAWFFSPKGYFNIWFWIRLESDTNGAKNLFWFWNDYRSQLIIIENVIAYPPAPPKKKKKNILYPYLAARRSPLIFIGHSNLNNSIFSLFRIIPLFKSECAAEIKGYKGCCKKGVPLNAPRTHSPSYVHVVKYILLS